MKKLLAIIILSFFTINFIVAQDTTIVQTLDFNDITKRRGWYIFPQDTSYQKVLMYYTLKCDAATTQDQYACGEWDYTTHTNLYQHENIDSARYSMNDTYPPTINYVTNPTYTYYEKNQYFITYNGVLNENNYSIGTGTNIQSHPFSSTSEVSRAQYIWTATELTNSGLTAGSIDKLKFDVSSFGPSLNKLSVKLAHTNLSTLINFKNTNLVETYNLNTNFTATGIDSLNFTTPFVWDGVSNILVELNFTNYLL